MRNERPEKPERGGSDGWHCRRRRRGRLRPAQRPRRRDWRRGDTGGPCPILATAASGVGIAVSPEQLRPSYDYIIVGAGSAGCVLAHRLGRAGRRVLLIEAGSPAKLAAIAEPPDWPELQGSSVDWRYATTAQPRLGGRTVPCPRGKVVGGSSAINALAYQRGHPAAYDRWPEGWRHADLLPYFRRAETFSVVPTPGAAVTVLCTCSHSPTYRTEPRSPRRSSMRRKNSGFR